MLRAAAEIAGGEVGYAQAEIKETWDVTLDEDQWTDRWSDDESEEYEEDEGPGGTGEGYGLNELIDDENCPDAA